MKEERLRKEGEPIDLGHIRHPRKEVYRLMDI